MGTLFDTGVFSVSSPAKRRVSEHSVGEAICPRREVVNVVNRPQDIEDEEAMTFFGGEEGDADESQG